MSTPILELQNIGCRLENHLLFNDINFAVNRGEIIVLQGRSGSGKSTLLKCIAHLGLHSGTVLYRGKTPQAHGVSLFRSKVLYVPQRPAMLPGNPTNFLNTITGFRSHKVLLRDNPHLDGSATGTLQRAYSTSKVWGIEPDKWKRDWMNLSGGEGQRILLAAAIALNTAEILLLDEPTSALDEETSAMVEEYLTERIKLNDTSIKALVWITHSTEQARRVGTRFVYMTGGGCIEGESPNSSPSPSALDIC